MQKKTAADGKKDENAFNSEELHSQSRHLCTLLVKLFKTFNFDQSHNLDLILEFIFRLVPCQFAVYDRFDLVSQEIMTCRGYGLPAGFRRRGRLAGRIGYEQWIGKGISPIILNEVHRTAYWRTDPDIKKSGSRAYLGSAVTVNSQPIGMLAVYSKGAASFTRMDLLIVEMMAEIISLMEAWRRNERNLSKRLSGYRKKLLTLVKARTSSLTDENQRLKAEIEKRTQAADELRGKTDRLEEINMAMRFLLDKRKEDSVRVEENTRFKLHQLISPYLDKLEASGMNYKQKQLLNVIRANFEEVVYLPVSDFNSRLTVLSPNELQVANLIHQGKTTKEIAGFLSVSERTVESYRHSIRKKLGLKNKKINLNTYLRSW